MTDYLLGQTIKFTSNFTIIAMEAKRQGKVVAKCWSQVTAIQWKKNAFKNESKIRHLQTNKTWE